MRILHQVNKKDGMNSLRRIERPETRRSSGRELLTAYSSLRQRKRACTIALGCLFLIPSRKADCVILGRFRLKG